MEQTQSQRQPKLKPMDLVATTAHEFKSPLVLISGLAEMLRAGQFGKLNPRQARYISRIDNASLRLLGMVENLLTIHRNHHGRLQIGLEPTSATEALKAVLKELQPALIQKQMTVVWAPDLKAAPVLADKQLLHQIFYNLLDNTIKYSPPKTTITIKFTRSSQYLNIQIRDQGFGIKPAELKKLFARFGAISKPISTQAGSSGLGLYIVKNLVELLGGHVRARVLKQGSCFSVSLPTVSQLELFTPSETDRPKRVVALPTSPTGRQAGQTGVPVAGRSRTGFTEAQKPDKQNSLKINGSPSK